MRCHGFRKKAHFNRCLTVLGTTKTTYKAIYFVQNYVLKCKLLKAIWGRWPARLRGRQFQGAFLWEYSGIRMYSGIYYGYSAPGSTIARMESRYSGMRIAPKQTLTCIIPIILILDWSQTNAPSECFSQPAALAGSDKKRSMANLAELTVNYKAVW